MDCDGNPCRIHWFCGSINYLLVCLEQYVEKMRKEV